MPKVHSPSGKDRASVVFEVDGHTLFAPKRREWEWRLTASSKQPVKQWGEWCTTVLETLNDRGAFFANVARGLALLIKSGGIVMRSLVWQWQPQAFSNEPSTPLGDQLQGTALVLVNYDWHCPAGSLRCIDCGGSDIKDLSWHENAHSTKGNGAGGIHTYYVATKRRQCQ